MKKNNRGAILPLVCSIFIVLTFVFTALLNSTGVLLSRIPYYENRLQEQYNAESAILLELYGVHSKSSFPAVEIDTIGPWLMLETQAGERNVKAFAGFYTSVKNPSFSHNDRLQAFARCFSFYQKQWQEESFYDTLHGNTHFYKPELSHFPGVLYVATGDLDLYLHGERFPKIAFFVEGNVLIEGEGILDTLRLYSTGSIHLSGQIKIREASLYARQMIHLSGQVHARGSFLSEDTVIVSSTVSMGIPFLSNSLSESKDSVFMPIDLSYPSALRIFSWSIE